MHLQGLEVQNLTGLWVQLTSEPLERLSSVIVIQASSLQVLLTVIETQS